MPTGLPARMLAACAVLALAGQARAERRPVAVVSLSADADASQLARELYIVLVAHPDLQPLRDAVFVAALQGPFEDEDAAALVRARQARSDADAALRLAQPDFRTAETASMRGARELAGVVPTSEVLGLYAELMFDLGQAHLGQRRPNEASLAFALAGKLDPLRRPDPAKYFPEIIEAYAGATAKPKVAARLEVKGAGSVWIDGIEEGHAPGTFATTEGLHLVQLTGPDREPRGEQVRVPQVTSIEIAPAPATEELKIKRVRRELSRATDPAARAGLIKRLAQLLGVADAVILAKSAAGALVVQTWRDREPGFSAIREHGSEQPIDLLTPLAPPRKPEPPREIIPPPPPIVRIERWHDKAWVRASLATGVLAVIVTAVVVARHEPMLGFDRDIKPVE